MASQASINLHGIFHVACTKLIDGLLADWQQQQHGYDCQRRRSMFLAIAHICSLSARSKNRCL